MKKKKKKRSASIIHRCNYLLNRLDVVSKHAVRCISSVRKCIWVSPWSRSEVTWPKLPSSASVSREATVKNALNLREVNLIGVYGKPSDRRALVRLGNGRYRKVEVGDRLDGGRVSAIGDAELRYNKSGRAIVLKMPRGWRDYSAAISPLAICSCSMLSKSALKLPSPKPSSSARGMTALEGSGGCVTSKWRKVRPSHGSAHGRGQLASSVHVPPRLTSRSHLSDHDLLKWTCKTWSQSCFICILVEMDIWLCVCVCVCVRERGGRGKGENSLGPYPWSGSRWNGREERGRWLQ